MADSANSKNYGVPIYGAGWVPPSALRSAVEPSADDEKDDGDKSSSSETGNYVVLAGGGGEGNSGIRNALIVAQFDFDSNVLSDEPVARLGTGGDLPYRMAVHPGGEGLICSLPKSCRWFDWDFQTTENRSLGLRSSEKALEPLEDVGQQLALTFNNEGSLLAVGGEDGKLTVFKWPSMENILDQANAHASVKDLDFSPDGKFLASVGSGPCRIWDVSKSTSVASLTKENDEIFGYCRFAPINDENQVLYITTMRDQGGSISKWSTTTWRRIKSKRVVRDPICAFNISPNGKLLAIGTIEGDVLIVSSNNLQVQNVVKKAHLGLVTTLKFSEDSRSLLSASLDSRVRVTIIKEEKKSGLSLWIVILVLLIAIAVYYAASNGILPLELNSILK
ncbi:SEC12-like protein 2 [Solanum stenotomum]|uniref:SEC12-like protein 2 n=1 Tax=Solanum stenotomum TaxID=172797 RepID=UPI0020D1B431|nr:SEC12-like protein 2 [Solanum stenotomum]